MLTAGWNNSNSTRLPFTSSHAGNTSQQQKKHQHQQQQQKQQVELLLHGTPRRPASTDSTQSIDNAYSLEHLFVALRRRIHRIVQTYNAKSFHDALKICARLFQSYASYNLNTIDEFARRLSKNIRDNKKVLTVIDQFRLQLSELRHCHSTFEAELLVTTLAIDFHEDEIDPPPAAPHQEQQPQVSLPPLIGKFSPRTRLSKFRVRYARQATEIKSQLKQINEQLQILLFDEFYTNMSNLWEESEKYILTSVPFHDHHMTYVLRLIPDIVLKLEFALQLCTKLFDLETTMLENCSQTNRYQDNNHMNAAANTSTNVNNMNNNVSFNPFSHPSTHQHHATIKHSNETTPVTIASVTPRSDYIHHQQPRILETHREHNNDQRPKHDKHQLKQPLPFFSADLTTSSSNSSAVKAVHVKAGNSMSMMSHEIPVNLISQGEENPIFPLLFSGSEIPVDYRNDQNKLQILVDQLEKRLIDEELYRKRLMNCVKQTAKKSEQLNRFPKNNLLTLVMSDEPALAEYQKGLCLSDYQIHKSVSDELNIAIKESQYRIDWINMVRTRALQCLNQ